MNLIKSSVLGVALATSVGCSDSKQNTQYQQDKSTENRDSIEDNQNIDPNSEQYLSLLNIRARVKVVSISPKTYESDFVYSKKDLITGKDLLQRPDHSIKDREKIISNRIWELLTHHDFTYGYPQSMKVGTEVDGDEYGKYIDVIPKNPKSNCINAVMKMRSKYNANYMLDGSFKYTVSFNEFRSSGQQRSVVTMRNIRNDAKKLVTSGSCDTNDIQIIEGKRDYFTNPSNVVVYLTPNIEGVVTQDIQKLIETLKKEGIAENGSITEKDILVRPSNLFYNPEDAITTDAIMRSLDGENVTIKRMKR